MCFYRRGSACCARVEGLAISGREYHISHPSGHATQPPIRHPSCPGPAQHHTTSWLTFPHIHRHLLDLGISGCTAAQRMMHARTEVHAGDNRTTSSTGKSWGKREIACSPKVCWCRGVYGSLCAMQTPRRGKEKTGGRLAGGPKPLGVLKAEPNFVIVSR